MPSGHNFVGIAGGSFHSVALKADGALVAWGDNSFGQCNVPAGNDFVDISAGWRHNIALKSDGSLVAWGSNNQGQCNVPAGNDFVAFSAGWWQGLALKSDGSLVAWGFNAQRQCNVPSGNDFIGIIAGRSHSLALKADGSLTAWGSNNQGQTNVPAGNDLVAVSAGEFHNLALVIGGARTIYVDTDANGANDGSNWQDGFNHLQDALAAARSHDEIRIAEGVYKPDEDTAHPDGTGNSFVAFELKNSVLIYGGYAGFGQSDPNERNVNAYETVLSGHLRVDDHSLHVVTARFTDATAILDGLTITGGHGLSPNIRERSGGGMFNLRASPTVRNCMFTGNSVSNGYGGAVYNDLGSPTFSRCVFNGNSAALDGAGGGMYNAASSPMLTNCVFIGNSARYGGGIYNKDRKSLPVLTNCTFSRNSATEIGGAVFNEFQSSLTAANCILWNDTPQEIHLDSASTSAATYSDVQGGWPGQGNIDVEPRFVDPAPGVDNYRLLPDSPCIDAGDNNSLPADSTDLDGDGNTTEPTPWDLDGNPRIVDGDHDGVAAVDMGAYEAMAPVPMEVPMKLTPQALNAGSRGKWVKAHFVLPEEFGVEDVDANSPARITEPFEPDIESEHLNVLINQEGLVEVEAAFDRSRFSLACVDGSVIEVTVIGLLTAGRQFYGTDTVKITNNVLKSLAGLASHWLGGHCDGPDWCGGFDLDQNSVVDFADFVLLDGCSIQIIDD